MTSDTETRPDISAFDLDAYGHINYGVGWSDEAEDAPEDSDRGDWLACVDADRIGDWVGYHVIVNSDSGGFIDTLDAGVLSVEEAKTQLPELLSYWQDIASEHLIGASAWFTDAETRENAQAIAKWRAYIETLTKDN
jgi:hypothetical protein